MTVARPPAILDHLSALADTTRSRLLLLLDRHELTVSELCTIMQLPQSTVSRHLKALADAGWVGPRAGGHARQPPEGGGRCGRDGVARGRQEPHLYNEPRRDRRIGEAALAARA